MTIRNIRELFTAETTIILVCTYFEGDELRQETLYTNNTFFGISAFADMAVQFRSITASDCDTIEIETDMPIEVFRSMKEYISMYSE